MVVALALLMTVGPAGSDRPRAAVSGLVPSSDRTDLAFYAAIVERTRHEGYYAASTAEITARGYYHSSFFNWRLPTLAVIEAALPSIAIAELALVILGIWAAWLINAALPRDAIDLRMATLAATFTMLPLWLVSGRVVYTHEVWTGGLIALSLGLWPRRPLGSVAAGLAAVLIRELAIVYLVAMLAAAFLAGRRREAIAWAASVGLFAAVLAFHAHAVAPFIQPGVRNGWLAFGGTDFVLAAFRANPAALALPTAVLIVVVAVAVVGLWSWPHPARLRIATTVTLYALIFLVVGRPDEWYWGFLIAPIWPLGLVGFGAALMSGRRRRASAIAVQANHG